MFIGYTRTSSYIISVDIEVPGPGCLCASVSPELARNYLLTNCCVITYDQKDTYEGLYLFAPFRGMVDSSNSGADQ
jgi:hypothetical protein